MKPLVLVISFNRCSETHDTIMALHRTGTMEDATVVVFDNGSRDKNQEMLFSLADDKILFPENILFSEVNLGCPQALNFVMSRRRHQGQDFVKIDNDVEMLTDGWVKVAQDFMAENEDVYMMSPWYSELDAPHAQARIRQKHENWYEALPIPGHCTYHRGSFLDRTGFFDVLGKGHLYGYEDNLMCHRAVHFGGVCAILPGIQVKNIQRWSSLDVARNQHSQSSETAAEHVRRFRPLYWQRLEWIAQFGRQYIISEEGKPCLISKLS